MLRTWKCFERNYWAWLLYDVKNYADLGGCYPSRPSASADNG